jgi:hypothetical protein
MKFVKPGSMYSETIKTCILMGRPAGMWGALHAFYPPCTNIMLPCAAGLHNNAAGRVKTLQN